MRFLQAGLVAMAALAAGCLNLSDSGRVISRVHGQVVESLLPDQPVPSGYVTQSIFLICNPEWILKEKEEDLNSLHAYFIAFGRAIGEHNAAVWFWRNQPDLEDGLADDVDVERSAALCAELQLKPSESPHLVVTSKWDKDHLTLALGGLDADSIKTVLTRLSNSLVAGGIDAADVQSEVYWQTWRTATADLLRNLGRIARPLKVTINTLFFVVEFDGSQL
jgi:hypothetical protein